MEPKYPHVHVQLTGQDGNAMVIIANVRKALRTARVPTAELNEFLDEAMSSDYSNVLRTAMRWVDVS